MRGPIGEPIEGPVEETIGGPIDRRTRVEMVQKQKQILEFDLNLRRIDLKSSVIPLHYTVMLKPKHCYDRYLVFGTVVRLCCRR